MSQDNPGTPNASVISIVVHPPILTNPLPIVADLTIPSDTESEKELNIEDTKSEDTKSDNLLSPPFKPIRIYRPNTPMSQHYPIFTYSSSDDEK